MNMYITTSNLRKEFKSLEYHILLKCKHTDKANTPYSLFSLVFLSEDQNPNNLIASSGS